MKALTRLFLSCIVIVFAQATHAQGWVKFDAKQDMKFTVLFPQKPQIQEQNAQTAVGPVKVSMAMVDLSQDTKATNMLYMASHTLFPDSVNADKIGKTDAFFEGSINGMIKNVQGTVTSTKTISYKTFPGREVKADVQGQATITARLYLIHSRLYILLVFSPVGKDDNADVAKFLNSFESE